MSTRALVTGAGGFIGDHLVRYLKDRGYWVRGVDIKPPRRLTVADEFLWCDMRDGDAASAATRDIDWVFALAANHGGVGHITSNAASVVSSNMLINLKTVLAAYVNGASLYFFPSSVCVYPRALKARPETAALKEESAFPADPEHAYGWEKLIAEIVLSLFFGGRARIARFHTIFGEWCEWTGGKEKVTPALARKVAVAKMTGNPRVEIWGDGQQTRTFLYVSDCIEMVHRLMHSNYWSPINIGADRQITIDELADMFAEIAGIEIEKDHVEGPVGERFRGADLTKMYQVLGRDHDFLPLEQGLARLYHWVEKQVEAAGGKDH